MPSSRSYRILHIFNDPKFSEGFFNFLIQHGDNLKDDFLFHYRYDAVSGKNYGMPAIFSPGFFSLLPNIRMLSPLVRSKKIVIHSLASPFLLVYLWLIPGIAKKSYWVVWGKDLYFYDTLAEKKLYHHVYEFFRRRAIRKIGHVITYNRGDYELARKWYQCNGRLHRSFMYPSNLYRELPFASKSDGPFGILLGNSADPSNMHLEAFSMLEKYAGENIAIITPLSYGEESYTHQVIERGREVFGDKFRPLTEFVSFKDYLEILQGVDAGFFAHRRQQAMGNITNLLTMRKKVFMRDDITTWELMQELGIKVFDLSEFNLESLEIETANRNLQRVREVFSEQNLLKQWNDIVTDVP